MSKKIYFTPGPAQLFYTFEEHFKKALLLDIPSISHRSSSFLKVVEETTEALKEVLELPAGYDIYFLNSANEAWDRIIQNLVEHSSHHFSNGAFSKKFHDFAIAHNKSSTCHEKPDGQEFTNWIIPEAAELIGITKNETSVGYSVTEDELANLRRQNPEKLIALDIVSASPSLPVNFANVDTAYLLVQKAFGLPAGLGIWIVNERCHDQASTRAEKTSLGSYRSLPNLKKFGDKHQTPETPNMLSIYLLGKICQDMLRSGIGRMRNETVYKATILNQAIGTHPYLNHCVTSKEHQSKTTIVANATNAKHVIQSFERKGIILSAGYGVHKDSHIRIANFPTHSKESVEMLVDLLQEIE